MREVPRKLLLKVSYKDAVLREKMRSLIRNYVHVRYICSQLGDKLQLHVLYCFKLAIIGKLTLETNNNIVEFVPVNSVNLTKKEINFTFVCVNFTKYILEILHGFMDFTKYFVKFTNLKVKTVVIYSLLNRQNVDVYRQQI